ncbi:MAG: carbohydrate ABC transporter permease, partial [Oscillospiraceae bacterium]
MKKKTGVFDIISMIILALLTIVFVFPFYWVITGSFKSQQTTIQIPPEWWPMNPTMDNYTTLFKQPAWQWFFNSVFIAFMTMLLVCIVSSLAGYVLAKKRFYGGTILFSLFVAAMALPKQVVLVPLVQLA